VLVLSLLNFGHDLQVRWLVFEVSNNRFKIVKFRITRLRRSLYFTLHIIQFSLHLFSSLLDIRTSTFKLVLLIPDVHNLARSRLKVLLKLLQFSPLLKQGFRRGSALIFKNLFAFEVSTFRTLNEFVSVVFVSYF